MEAKVESTKKEKQYGLKLNPKVIIGIVIVFLVLILFMGILTRIMPQGAYERELIDGKTHIINDSYKEFEQQSPLPIWRWFAAPVMVLATPDGIAAIAITIFMMIISGIYYVIDKSGFIKRVLALVVKKFENHKYTLLVVITLLCMAYGSVVGAIEGIIAIVPIFASLAIALGWDSLVGVGMLFVAALRGMAASTFNPYTVGLAQTMAGVPLYSGMWLRVLIFIISAVILLIFLVSYAKMIDRDPQRSLMKAADESKRDEYSHEEIFNIQKTHYPFKERFKDFFKGAFNYLPMIIVVAMILSLKYILNEGMIFDTIIYKLSLAIQGSSPVSAALLMLLTVFIVEIFLPGAMVKGFFMMPVLIPMGDIVGLTRQSTCLIFILGDSFANMIYPTDVMLIMMLGMIGCSYKKWMKWCGIFMASMIALCIGIVVFAVRIGY